MAQSRSHGNTLYAIERKAAFIATFLSNDPIDFSFSDLRSPITTSRGTLTTLKLSQEKLAWGEKNPNRLERSASAMVPYSSVELGLVKEVFTEDQHPCVLLCVVRATNKPGFRYEIMAFRLQSERDVQLFVNLFATLAQRQTAEFFRGTPFIRDEPSFSPPPSIRTRSTSTRLHTSVSMPMFSGTMPGVMSQQSQMDGHVFKVVDGSSRRNQPHNNIDSVRNSGDRHSDYNRGYEVQSRGVTFPGTGPGYSSVRMRSETESRRPTERANGRTINTRNVGVMADLDSSIPRSRPGDYLPLEGELSSQHERMYIYEDGSRVGEVFCQTNLRSPPRTISRRNNGSEFVWDNGRSDTTTRTGTTGTSGLSHHRMSQQFPAVADEVDSAAIREQRNRRSMQRRMTLVDNGVVKVTVEEYQDPLETKTEEFSPDGQSSDLTIDETDTNFERMEIDGRHRNRLQSGTGVPGRPSRSDSADGRRNRQPNSHESSPFLLTPPNMTSSVQRVFRRRSVPRLTSEAQHVSHPVEAHQTGRRRDRDDSVDRQYTTHGPAVVTQPRPVVIRNESMTTYSTHRPYSVHEPVYQSQPITTIRTEPTTYPVRHRSIARESVYQSQPITTRYEPISYPVRQHRSTAHESVYHSQPITIRAEQTINPNRLHRSTTQETVYQSRPTQMRQKSTNSVYGHERSDVYREPRTEYRLVTGTPSPGTIHQSKSRTMEQRSSR